MLSIVVNDALLGIDIMKKYPAFYTQMLVDEELRTAFLDTLELLEQSRSGELPEYIAPEPLNLDFLQQVMSKPIIRRSGTEKLELVWQRTVDQLQKMFQIALLRPQEIYRSEDTLFDTNPTNILHSQVEIGGQELNIRLDALQTPNNPENVELMITIFTAEELAHHFEATVVWGNYEASSRVNKYGLAKFPPLNTNLIFIPSGELIHGLELRLEQIS